MRGNRHILISGTAIVILLLIFVPAALAGKFHFNSLDFSVGHSLVLEGTLVGLGNEAAQVDLTAVGSVTALCENRGGQQAPGRNPISVEVEQVVTVTSDSDGRALVFVLAPDPTSPEFEPSPTPKEAGCPNGNWSVVDILDSSTNWSAARIVVLDEAGIIQIDQSFTCTTFFENDVAIGIECVEV